MDLSATDAVTVTTKRTAPTNLEASATTSSSTVLNWTASQNVTDVGYNVYNGDELEYATTSTETNYKVVDLLLALATLYSEIKK
jgi:hypothetical protein